MTYQGERARPLATESGRSFEVSKIRVGPDGHVSDVLWREVHPGLDRGVGPGVVAPSADVVDALHDGAQVVAVFSAIGHLAERAFVVVQHENGSECIAFEGPLSPGRNVVDIDSFDDLPPAPG